MDHMVNPSFDVLWGWIAAVDQPWHFGLVFAHGAFALEIGFFCFWRRDLVNRLVHPMHSPLTQMHDSICYCDIGFFFTDLTNHDLLGPVIVLYFRSLVFAVLGFKRSPLTAKLSKKRAPRARVFFCTRRQDTRSFKETIGFGTNKRRWSEGRRAQISRRRMTNYSQRTVQPSRLPFTAQFPFSPWDRKPDSKAKCFFLLCEEPPIFKLNVDDTFPLDFGCLPSLLAAKSLL